MRHGQGSRLTAEGRRRREVVRLEAARRFERRAPSAVITAELSGGERWCAGGARLAGWRPGRAGLLGASGAVPLDEEQLAVLHVVLDAGPLAAWWTDQLWTLARIRDLGAAKFKVTWQPSLRTTPPKT